MGVLFFFFYCFFFFCSFFSPFFLLYYFFFQTRFLAILLSQNGIFSKKGANKRERKPLPSCVPPHIPAMPASRNFKRKNVFPPSKNTQFPFHPHFNILLYFQPPPLPQTTLPVVIMILFSLFFFSFILLKKFPPFFFVAPPPPKTGSSD